MAAGTGDISASMDYNEVSGQIGGGKINQNKPKGMKANSDVFKKA
jgi:hypothetical protein